MPDGTESPPQGVSGAEQASASTSAREADEAASQETLRARCEVMIVAVDRFLANSWSAADAILAADQGGNLTIFAIQRAYYALYNVALGTAVLLDIPLERYQNGSHHHQENGEIPHAQLPVLVADLMKIVCVKEAASGDISKGEQAFETARTLQKYRLRADYMGCERVSPEGARENIQWAKTLVETIWGYAKEHHDDD